MRLAVLSGFLNLPILFVMDVGTAAGFTSLAFTTFRGCIRAYEFLQAAQNIGKHGEFLESKLQWEQYRLSQWGNRAGLGPGKEPIQRLNWSLILPYLRQLEDLLTSAEKLRARYHLDASEETAAGPDQASPTTGVGKAIAMIQPDFQRLKAQLIQSNNNITKKIRWAAVGKSKVNQIASDLSEINSRLESLLDRADGEWLHASQEALVREMISRSTDNTAVEEIRQLLDPVPSPVINTQALLAAAKLKQIRLYLGADFTIEEKRGGLRQELEPLTKLTTKKLVHQDPLKQLQYEGFEIGKYKKHGIDQTVLVEWRETDSGSEKKQDYHISRLTILMRSMADPSFHSLPCLGYFHDKSKKKFGIGYEILKTEMTEGEEIDVLPLESLIRMQSNPSLNCRLQIGRDLAETILQIHTAGWLHKGIRSENILFLKPRGSGADKALAGRAIIVGYGYARPDTAEAAEFTMLPDNKRQSDLYRHPEARGYGRKSYEKTFDLYSLGCVLLELALWKPLAEIHSAVGDRDWDAEVRRADEEELDLELPSLIEYFQDNNQIPGSKQAVGEKFSSAIAKCFGNMDEKEVGHMGALEVQKAVVKELSECVY
jgi:hypothetical protein